MSYLMRSYMNLAFLLLLATTVLSASVLSGCSQKSGVSEQQHLSQAKDFHDEGDLKSAIIELKNVLQQNPSHLEARWLLGKVYVEAGNGKAAEKELLRARDLGIDSAAVTVPLLHAYLMQGKAEEALRAAKINRNWSESKRAAALTLRGKAMLQLGKIEEASRQFKRAVELCAGCSDGYLGKALLAHLEGDGDEAHRMIAEAQKRDSDDVYVWWLLGDIEQADRNNAQSLDAYDNAIELRPQSVPLRLSRAVARIHEGELGSARNDIAVVRKLAPRHTRLNYIYGLMALTTGKHDEAQNYLESYLKSNSGHSLTHYYLGVVHYAQRHFSQSDKFLSRFLETHPDSVKTRQLVFSSRANLGRYEEALEVIQPIENEIHDAAFLRLLGQVYLRAGRQQKGLDYMDRAVAMDPESASIHAQAGATLLKEGLSREAGEKLAQALRLDPSNVELQALHIMAKLQEQDFDAALSLATEFQQDHSEDPLAYSLKATVFMRQGKLDEAEQSLQKALDLEPELMSAHFNLARIALRRDKPDVARRHFQAILEYAPEHMNTLLSLGELELRTTGDQGKAIDYFERAAKAYPGAITPNVALGQFYIGQGDYLKALTVARDGLNQNPKSPALLRILGQAQLGGGEISSAVSVFEKLATVTPDDPSAYYYLAIANASSGEVVRVRDNLEKALDIEPHNLAAKTALARLAYRRGDYQQSLALAKELKEEFPQRAEGDMVMAEAYVRQGKHEQAKQAYDRAMDRVESALLVREYAISREIAGAIDDAVRALREWLIQHPNDLVTRTHLGQLHMRHKQNEAAVEAFQAVLERSPDSVIALNNLALLYHESSEGGEEGLEYARRAYRNNSKNALIIDTLGWIELSHDNVKRGYELLQQAYDKAPRNATIAYHFAVALTRNGQPSKAKSLLSRIVEADIQFPERAEAKELLAGLD